MNKIIIFGASGDLARRKLMPAISKIYTKGLQVIGYSRSDLEESFSQEMRKLFDYKTDFPEQVKYIKGQYDDLSQLKGIIDSSTVLYFSVPPIVYNQILSGLASFNFSAIGIEKPFGNDLGSFRSSEYFKDSKIRFIDHYLLKPLMLSISQILHSNRALFDFLSNKTISSIDCYFIENLLAEGKNYFDNNGIVKDVMQSHLTEVIATILCNCKDNRSPSPRLEFIKSLKVDSNEHVFGQYETYQKDVRMGSETETFALLKCSSEDERWRNVPILMIAGKGLSTKATELVLGIRKSSFGDLLRMAQDKMPHPISEEKVKKMELVFNVAPSGEIYLRMSAEDGPVKVVLYDYAQVEKAKALEFKGYQDYEIIFKSLITQSYLPSVSYEEALRLWEMFDAVNSAKKRLIYYKNGSEMPNEALEFISAIKKMVGGYRSILVIRHGLNKWHLLYNTWGVSKTVAFTIQQLGR